MAPQFSLGELGAAASDFVTAQVANVALSITPELVPGSANRYLPSPFGLDLFTNPVLGNSDYVWEEAPGTYNGNLKILVFMTAEQDMTMANGHKFVSGNHPAETLVPIMHLAQAGFEFDFATPGGKPGVIEVSGSDVRLFWKFFIHLVGRMCLCSRLRGSHISSNLIKFHQTSSSNFIKFHHWS